MTFFQESERLVTSNSEQGSGELAETIPAQPTEAAEQHRGQNEADTRDNSDVDALCGMVGSTEIELRPTAPPSRLLSNTNTAQPSEASGDIGVTRSNKKERLTKRSSAKLYARPVKNVSTVTFSLQVIEADVII